MKGTPGYMAPEQIRTLNSAPIDVRADVYALGAILYAMLALTNPLARLSVDEILRRTVTGELPPPTEVAPEGRYVPAALEAICMKAMALRPADRYATVRELREDIFAFQSGYVPKAENASPLKHAGLFIGRNYLILLVLLTVSLSVALILLAINYYRVVAE